MSCVYLDCCVLIFSALKVPEKTEVARQGGSLMFENYNSIHKTGNLTPYIVTFSLLFGGMFFLVCKAGGAL